MIVSVLRKEARNNLKGKWKKALLIMLLFYMITILIGIAANWIALNTTFGMIAIILNIVITVSLNYGILVSFIKLKRNENINCAYFIYCAIAYGGKIWKIIGKIFVNLLLYILPLLLFLYLMITEFISLYYGYGMRLSYFVEILGVILFSVLLCMKVLYYSLNNYILYDNEKHKVKEILKESERLMKNHRWDFLKLNLSFIGWFVLGILFSVALVLVLIFVANIKSLLLVYIVYIPLIFLMPYTYITSVFFYDNLLYNNPKNKENITNNKKKKANKKK